MRKRILVATKPDPPAATSDWLDLDQVAEVELTSEDVDYPIESALRGEEPGWRAAEAGTQVIRLLFDPPQQLRRIRLVFEEHETARTQEFTLRWAADGSESYRDVLRQQFNFSPPDTTREVEEYTVDLDGVAALELGIVPEVSGGERRASLAEWRLA